MFELAALVKKAPFPPRLPHHKYACLYLGMDKNRFNREVQPYVAEFVMGVQGMHFDRLGLDVWGEGNSLPLSERDPQ